MKIEKKVKIIALALSISMILPVLASAKDIKDNTIVREYMSAYKTDPHPEDGEFLK